MLVVVVACRPKTAQRWHRRHAHSVRFQYATDLASGAGIIVEMLQRFAGRDAIERAGAKRQSRQVAEDRGYRGGSANVEYRLERRVNADRPETAVLQPFCELAESDRGVENA